MIPENAKKPADRRVKKSDVETSKAIPQMQKLKTAMPLLNTPCELGNVVASIDKIEDTDKETLTRAIENYIHFYNTKRYQFRLHYMALMEYHTAFVA